MARAFVVLVASIALAACGSDGTAGAGGNGAVGAPAPGGGLSVAEALGSAAGGPLLVSAYLVAEAGGAVARLCDAVADESYPPRCAEPSLAVEGLDLATVEGLRRDHDDGGGGGGSWTEAPVGVLGTLDGRVLTVSPTAR